MRSPRPPPDTSTILGCEDWALMYKMHAKGCHSAALPGRSFALDFRLLVHCL